MPFMYGPPGTTRAFFRGRSVARFNDAISSIQWDEIAFSDGRKPRVVSLPEPVDDERLEELNKLVNAENEFDDFFRELATTR